MRVSDLSERLKQRLIESDSQRHESRVRVWYHILVWDQASLWIAFLQTGRTLVWDLRAGTWMGKLCLTVFIPVRYMVPRVG